MVFKTCSVKEHVLNIIPVTRYFDNKHDGKLLTCMQLSVEPIRLNLKMCDELGVYTHVSDLFSEFFSAL